MQISSDNFVLNPNIISYKLTSYTHHAWSHQSILIHRVPHPSFLIPRRTYSSLSIHSLAYLSLLYNHGLPAKTRRYGSPKRRMDCRQVQTSLPTLIRTSTWRGFAAEEQIRSTGERRNRIPWPHHWASASGVTDPDLVSSQHRRDPQPSTELQTYA